MKSPPQTAAADAPPAGHSGRPVAHGPPVQVTFAACCLVFFATIIFWHNHNSMAYVHSTIQYSMEAPAGWLQSTSRTTVRALTIKNAEGKAVTRAAVTATTTTTTTLAATTQPTVAAAAAAGPAGSKQRQGRPHLKRSIISSAWHHLPRQGMQNLGAGQPVLDMREEGTAAAAAEAVPAAVPAGGAGATPPVPEADRDIELHPARVAEVVQHAKAAVQLQQAKQQEQEALDASAATPAEQYAGLYGADGPGDMLLEQSSDLNTCPQGTAAPKGATALVLLADSSSGAAVLKRSLDGLLLVYSRASADVRAGYHLFMGLDGEEPDMTQLAHSYALDSLGTLKLVHRRHNSSGSAGGSSGSSSEGSRDAQTAPGSSSSSVQQPGDSRQQAVGGSVRAEHVRVMLHVLLRCLKYPSVLLLEDDYKLLPDFLDYFAATQWLLTSDPSLYCISAWNPLGQPHGQHQQQLQQQQQPQQQQQQKPQQQQQQKPQQQQQQRRKLQHSSSSSCQLQRSDTNPGRGWLLSRATGLLLLNSWPTGVHAVDWQQHIHSWGLQHGRQCVVPEVRRMLPADVRDTGSTAHIVEEPAAQAVPDPDAAAAEQGVAGAAVQQPQGAESSSSNTGASNNGDNSGDSGDSSNSNEPVHRGNPGAPTAGADAGVVDAQAEAAPGVAWAPAADATNVTLGGTAGDAQAEGGDSSSSSSSSSTVQPQQPDEPATSAWSSADLSYLLGSNYRRLLHQALLAAEPVDASTAAQLTDSQAAVRVEYTTAPELAAAAGALGLPLASTQARYCYSLPTEPPTQHCQDNLPDTAYEGVVIARTQQGAHVYLVHTAYMTALLGPKQQAKNPADTAAGAA